MQEQIAYTRAMFARGCKLIGMVDRELAVDLDLFTRGGLEILRAIEARKYDVLSAQADHFEAAQGDAAAACAGWPLRAGDAAGGNDGLTQSQPIEEAYAACRAIARREAKNFYYAFVALPAQKRDAMCAIYAFMRHADDISDDESKDHATTARRNWRGGQRHGARRNGHGRSGLRCRP